MINIVNWLRHQFANSDAEYLPGAPPRLNVDADVVEWIRNHFPEEDRREAIHRIDQCALRGRVARCVVLLSRGNIANLDRFIKAADEDWRDVISWAEYDGTWPNQVQVRDLTQTLPVELRLPE